MSVQSITITDVCDDILRHIFDKYLDLKTQLRTQLVCKLFYKLIEEIFDGKRWLCLTDKLDHLNDITDEDFRRYKLVSVEELCQIRNPLWIRGERGLKLLSPIDIQMLTLKRYRFLTALCLVVHNRWQLESIIDLIIDNCPSNLEKLIIININGQKLTINERQMQNLCRQYSGLKHFELFSDYLYATEETFDHLMSNCRSLKVFKLNVRHIFSETFETLGPSKGRSVTYNSFRFNGFSFRHSSESLTTIDVSHPILNNHNLIHNFCHLDGNPFLNVKHLGVERINPKGMEAICRLFQSLKSLSISMIDELNANEVMSLISTIHQLKDLKKLSIRWFGGYHSSNKTLSLNKQILFGLNNCQNLRHLVIKEAIVDNDSLKVINRCVSSLESLRIVDCVLSLNTFQTLNAFKYLKELVIMRSHPDQTFLKFKINQNDEILANSIVTKCIEVGLIDSPSLKNNGNSLNDENHEIDDNQEPVIVFGIQMEENEPMNVIHFGQHMGQHNWVHIDLEMDDLFNH